jgi:Tfp pilus assembly protein PilV
MNPPRKVRARLERRSKETGKGYCVSADCYVLPADKKSIDLAVVQMAAAIAKMPRRSCWDEIARAALASIGIKEGQS